MAQLVEVAEIREILGVSDAIDDDRIGHALLGPSRGGGRSIFQKLTLTLDEPVVTDIEALTESTGAGYTVHGDFLFAEVIDDGGEDLSFCMRANALEIPVHVHTGVKTTHLKHLWLDERIYDRLARLEGC